MNTLFEKSNRESLHSRRVSEYCKKIAIEMSFEKNEINKIEIAGLLHDIGKIITWMSAGVILYLVVLITNLN